MSSARDLATSFAHAAHGYNYETVIDAAANLLRNALAQRHKTLGASVEQLDDIVQNLKTTLAANHYGPDGERKNINIAPAGMLFPHLDGESAKLMDRVLGRK